MTMSNNKLSNNTLKRGRLLTFARQASVTIRSYKDKHDRGEYSRLESLIIKSETIHSNYLFLIIKGIFNI